MVNKRVTSNSIESLLQWATELLIASEHSTDSPQLDARILLAHCLSKNTTYLMTWPEIVVSQAHELAFKELISLRKEGRPVAHLVGYKDFWSVSLEVNSHTLIPRPETELLVEHALQLDLSDNAKVLDLGTGTGAIAIALASEKPKWQVTGIDKVEQAVTLARRNAARNGTEQVIFEKSDWFEQIGNQKFDLIVSNPPYVESTSPYLSQGDVRFEPLSALTAGEDGMLDIEAIIPNSLAHLLPGGWLSIEHGFNQAEKMRACFQKHGFININLLIDLNDLPRVTCAQKPR